MKHNEVIKTLRIVRDKKALTVSQAQAVNVAIAIIQSAPIVTYEKDDERLEWMASKHTEVHGKEGRILVCGNCDAQTLRKLIDQALAAPEVKDGLS